MTGRQLYLGLVNLGFKIFRTRRLKFVYGLFNIDSTTRILDVGGSTIFWKMAAKSGLPVPDVTVVNVIASPDSVPDKLKWVIADGAHLPFPDHSFDLVFCNSVMEHVTPAKREAVAAEIVRVAPRYFVQTPNKWFPIEAHFYSPFIHWVPRRYRTTAAYWLTLWSWLVHPTRQQCADRVAGIALLNRTDFVRLFPDAEIRSERVLGWAKSFMAIKDVA